MSTPTFNSVGTTILNTLGLGNVGALLAGSKWGGGYGSGVGLTYSFIGGANSGWHINPYSDSNEFNAWSPLTAKERDAVVKILKIWAAVANVSFTKVADNKTTVGDLRFARTDNTDGNAHAYFPLDHPTGGDVWFNDESWHLAGSSAVKPGTYDYFTVLHEIGHALGLKHPFAGGQTLPGNFDTYSFTVMSYSAYPGGDNAADFYPTTPMWYDLIAIQLLYGARNHANGDTTYVYKGGQHYWQTIDDSGGTDRIVYQGSDKAVIDLRIGHWSDLGRSISFFLASPDQADNVMIGPRSVIENATGGGGNDRIVGNASKNRLEGGGGKDTMLGGGGADRLVGGPGGDTLTGGAGGDRFVFKHALGPGNVDRITDFAAGDLIELSASIFKGIGGTGGLAKAYFHAGPGAADQNDRIVYSKATGALSYDGNGSQPGGSVQFAALKAGTVLSHTDFVVIA